MTNDHVADAGHPRKTAFLRLLAAAAPVVLPKRQFINRRLAAPILAGTLTAFAAPAPTSKDGAAIRRANEATLGSAKQNRSPSVSGDSPINPATGGDPAETPSQRPSGDDGLVASPQDRVIALIMTEGVGKRCVATRVWG